MKKMITVLGAILMFCGCTSLTYQERQTLRSLKSHGITVENAAGGWERPASPAAAGGLNLLPGFGNFYLATEHYLYGTLNLLTWPVSILWGVPEGVLDANRINEKELIYFYTYDESGRQALEDKDLIMNNKGIVEKKDTVQR